MPASALAFTLFKIPPAEKYKLFSIPKKSGGKRNISSPNARLKSAQTYLKDLLAECRAEIEARYPKRKLISHGFRADGSIMTNAAQHRARRYVLNTDFENFFPSFNFGRVRGYFINNKHFALHPAVATVIAQIACHQNELPQGSPCSPIISDLIAQVFDMRMVKLMKRHKCTYSRYADDLTISTNKKNFPEKLAYQLEEGGSAWVAGSDLLDVVYRVGLSLNHKKTRMQYRGSRQVVTGLIVNRRVNVKSEYYRTARSMCHSLFQTGHFVVESGSPTIYGPSPAGKLSQLEGIVNHIYHVKSREDARVRSTPPFDEHRGIELLYRNLLAFKSFVTLDKPLVIAEGKTDNVYLRAAIKHSPAYAGILANQVSGKYECAVKFFEQGNLSRTMLGLGASSSYFPRFIHSYVELIAKFKYAPLQHPVIILIDNDDGAKKVFGALNQLKITIDHKSTAPFYLIARNLYLIKTPEIQPNCVSQIENLFDTTVTGTKHNGKTFNMKNDTDTATEYGKSVFADYVVAPNAAKINFAGFKPLLDRLVATINDHTTRLAAGTV